MQALLASGWNPPADPESTAADDEVAEELENEGSASLRLTAEAVVGSWVPWCRTPTKLYRAYQGDDFALTSGNYEDARRDLAMFGMPTGLDEPAFQTLVRATLLQVPAVAEFDAFIRERPRSLHELQTMAEPLVPSGPWMSREEAWDTMREWLVAFFPGAVQAKPLPPRRVD